MPEKALTKAIERIRIIDCHEHLRMPREKRPGHPLGLFELFANKYYLFRTNYYVYCDLVSAGMDPEIWVKKTITGRQAYRTVAPYLEQVRSSSYFRSFYVGLKELYGFRGSLESEQEWLALDGKVKRAYQDDGWEMFVLRKKAKLEKMFYSYGWKVEPKNFFLPVLRMDNYFNFAYRTWPDFKVLRWPLGWEMDHETTLTELGVRIKNFDDFIESVDRILKRAKKEKTVAVKMGTAYSRSLKFERAPFSAARKIFSKWKTKGRVSFAEARKFEDATLPLLIEKCIQYDLPIQFHTGFLAGNVGPARLLWINPLFLQNLFCEYPQARFVLFHGGYPYFRESLMLAKKYPNVCLDICWLPLISYSAARLFLTEALETVPANKIMWGGDYHNVEAICGAVRIMRQLLGEVLEEKVRRKEITGTQAGNIARKILNQNAREVFKL